MTDRALGSGSLLSYGPSPPRGRRRRTARRRFYAEDQTAASRHRGTLHCSARNFREVGNTDQAVLAGEREGLIAALGLGYAENPMIARVVDGDRASIVDHQAAGVGKDSVSKIVLRADGARPAQSGRPPISRS
jgi:hypothetical protein